MITGAIKVDVNRCTGCRYCEVVCGFHFTGKSDPASAAITINRDTITGAISWQVTKKCNLCAELKLPICIDFCSFNAINLSPE